MHNWLENILWFVVIRLFKEPETIEYSQWDMVKQKIEYIENSEIFKEPGSFAAYSFPENTFNQFIDKLLKLEDLIRHNRLEKHPRAAVFEIDVCYYNDYFSNGKSRYRPERIKHVLVNRMRSITELFEKLCLESDDTFKKTFYQHRVEAALEACLTILENFYHGQ